jgi:hypothetical protein
MATEVPSTVIFPDAFAACAMTAGVLDINASSANVTNRPRARFDMKASLSWYGR